MCSKKFIRNGNVLVVPLVPAIGFVPTNQKDGVTSWIERETDANVASARAEFLHIREHRSFQCVNEWSPERRSMLSENLNCGDNLFLDMLLLIFEPIGEDLCSVDLPFH